jgi:hypothetical protein
MVRYRLGPIKTKTKTGRIRLPKKILANFTTVKVEKRFFQSAKKLLYPGAEGIFSNYRLDGLEIKLRDGAQHIGFPNIYIYIKKGARWAPFLFLFFLTIRAIIWLVKI